MTQPLTELPGPFGTGRLRSVYSPATCGSEALIADEIAARLGQDPVANRQSSQKTDRQRAVPPRAVPQGHHRRGRGSGAGSARAGVAEDLRADRRHHHRLPDCPRPQPPLRQPGAEHRASTQLQRAGETVDASANLRALCVKRGVTGPRYGCGINVCDACTGHLDGEAFNPGKVATAALVGRTVTIIEGLAGSSQTDLHPVRPAWLERDVAQCGYCQPEHAPNPADTDIDAMDNVCRCGSCFRIR